MEPRNLDRSWQALRASVDLEWLRLHDLRHALATFMIATGSDPRTVMKTLGHSQISLTMNTTPTSCPTWNAKRSTGLHGRCSGDERSAAKGFPNRRREPLGCICGCKGLVTHRLHKRARVSVQVRRGGAGRA